MTDVLSIGKITALALADSVNPCAIAVLTMILMTVLIQNPDKKRKVLAAGAAFISAVFISYLLYGVIILKFFMTFANVLRGNAPYLYDFFGIVSMILGALNIKDFITYTKGNFATEMPIFLRPKVKKIIDKISSTKGAFVTGFLLTLFLLPCTVGPYIVASGFLVDKGILGALPWLLYYNLLFVLPMIIIVGLVYFGFAKVDEVSGWKEKNVRILHLIAGILLFLVGTGILLRWI